MKFAISEEEEKEQMEDYKEKEYVMDEDEKKRFDSFSSWFTDEYKEDVNKEY